MRPTKPDAFRKVGSVPKRNEGGSERAGNSDGPIHYGKVDATATGHRKQQKPPAAPTSKRR